MPLSQYGVVKGTLVRSERDDPDDFGRWRHVTLIVDAGGGRRLRAAVDVDSKDSAVGVQWKVLRLTDAQVGLPVVPSPGFTALTSAPGTGALDVIRHSAIRTRWVVRFLLGLFSFGDVLPASRRWIWLFFLRPWRSGDHLEASQALEGTLTPGAAVLIWGEPFPEGSAPATVQGTHNVHQNQGDPAGSQWWAENGIWQDGGVATLQADGRWLVFVSKFSTQAYRTDSAGHPA